MGADVFFTRASGKTAQDAFDEAVRRARHDYGHAGYTGSIAEKDGYAMIAVPEGAKVSSFADRLIDECDPRVDDKWGPAGCIHIETDSESGMKEFLFFGWASS